MLSYARRCAGRLGVQPRGGRNRLPGAQKHRFVNWAIHSVLCLVGRRWFCQTPRSGWSEVAPSRRQCLSPDSTDVPAKRGGGRAVGHEEGVAQPGYVRGRTPSRSRRSLAGGLSLSYSSRASTRPMAPATQALGRAAPPLRPPVLGGNDRWGRRWAAFAAVGDSLRLELSMGRPSARCNRLGARGSRGRGGSRAREQVEVLERGRGIRAVVLVEAVSGEAYRVGMILSSTS